MLHVSANFAENFFHFFFPQILTRLFLRYLDFILIMFFLKPLLKYIFSVNNLNHMVEMKTNKDTGSQWY